MSATQLIRSTSDSGDRFGRSVPLPRGRHAPEAALEEAGPCNSGNCDVKDRATAAVTGTGNGDGESEERRSETLPTAASTAVSTGVSGHSEAFARVGSDLRHMACRTEEALLRGLPLGLVGAVGRLLPDLRRWREAPQPHPDAVAAARGPDVHPPGQSHTL